MASASPPVGLLYRKTNMIAPHSELETPEPLMKLPAVAAILKVGYLTAWKLVKAGSIPSYRVGRLYRVTASGLNQYLDSTANKGSY